MNRIGFDNEAYITKQSEMISKRIGEFGGKVWGGIEEAFSGMWNFGHNLGVKIWNGIKSMWGKFKDALDPRNWFTGGAIDMGELAVNAVVKQGYTTEQAQEALGILKDKGEASAKAYLSSQNKTYNGMTESGVTANPVIKKLDEVKKGLENVTVNVTAPVFIGNEQIDEQNIKSSNRVQVRSGGQV